MAAPTLTLADLRAWSVSVGVSRRSNGCVFHPALATLVSQRLKRVGAFNIWFADDSVRHIYIGPNGRAAARTYAPDSDYARDARNAYTGAAA